MTDTKFLESAIMERIAAGKSYAESLLEGMLYAAHNDPVYLEWKKSPEGIAHTEESKKRDEGKTRDEKTMEIIRILEKLGYLPKAGDSE